MSSRECWCSSFVVPFHYVIALWLAGNDESRCFNRSVERISGRRALNGTKRYRRRDRPSFALTNSQFVACHRCGSILLLQFQRGESSSRRHASDKSVKNVKVSVCISQKWIGWTTKGLPVFGSLAGTSIKVVFWGIFFTKLIQSRIKMFRFSQL